MNDYVGTHYAERRLPDGRCAWVVPLTFDRARLIVGCCHSATYDDGW